MTFAVLADIHGNRWALEAVLEELDRLGVGEVVDLGDCLYGPLDPGGTLEILRRQRWPTVRGNMERMLLEPAPRPASFTHELVADEIGSEGIEWIRDRTRAPFALHGAFHCHGTPRQDDRYLLEAVGPDGVVLRDAAALADELAATTESLVTCGHSHVPRLATAGSGVTVVNPGSVGLPAYEEETPVPYAMESGSPHARFALAERDGGEGWHVRHLAVAYDHRAAARTARRNGRSDWSDWLMTGRGGGRG